MLFFRSVFGSFPSVASAGLCLQCRWPGVKFALSKPQLAGPTATARTLLPDTGAVPLGADAATEGNEPHHLRDRRRRALAGPPYGAAPVPRGSQEPPPEAPGSSSQFLTLIWLLIWLLILLLIWLLILLLIWLLIWLLTLLVFLIWLVGWPGASQPRAPTDPDVTVSRHPALVVLVTGLPGA